MDFNEILIVVRDWFFSSGLKIVLILVITLIAVKIIRVISSKATKLFLRKEADVEAQKRAKTLSSVIRNVLNAFIYIVAFLTILRHLGIEIGPLLAAAGIAGLAIGFAGQSLVKDIINGFFILLWDQIRVGDVVRIAGEGGFVERINLKMTVLRDLAGNVHYIPNGNIDLVTNMTKEFSRYVFDIGVSYREDVDEVIEVIKKIDEEMRNDPEYKDDILEPIEILGLNEFADSAVIIRARTTTMPIKQWRIGREFNRRLKKRFDEKDIEIPFPHVTLYMGEDKQGMAPPMQVAIQAKKDKLNKKK